ncbi:MAG: hypothetical protein D6776_02385 [Planctomycetota bacterium]|nr:MAG: hypothetical protein D6776_02385 [Planctomycetota bacterium]
MAHDDEILIKRSSHPVVTALLIATALALIAAIWLDMRQLAWYVNPETRKLTREFTIKPIEIDRRQYPDVEPQQDDGQEPS